MVVLFYKEFNISSVINRHVFSKGCTTGWTPLDYVMLTLRIAGLFLITVIVVLLIKDRGQNIILYSFFYIMPSEVQNLNYYSFICFPVNKTPPDEKNVS